MNVRPILTTLFHVGMCTMYLVPIGWYFGREGFFPGRWPALTYWNLWIQAVYFGFSAVVDVLWSAHCKYPRLIKVRDKMFASIVLPLGTFVFAMFWSLFLVDRDLIFPVEAEEFTPPWTNHISHTAILPVILLEMWLVKHRYPRQMDGLLVTLLFGLTYLVWILFLYSMHGYWPYGILNVLHPGFRILMFSGCLAGLAIFYLVGEKLNQLIWSQTDSQTEFAKKAFGENEKGMPLLEVEYRKSPAIENDDRPDSLLSVVVEELSGAESSQTRLLRSSEQDSSDRSSAC